MPDNELPGPANRYGFPGTPAPPVPVSVNESCEQVRVAPKLAFSVGVGTVVLLSTVVVAVFEQPVAALVMVTEYTPPTLTVAEFPADCTTPDGPPVGPANTYVLPDPAAAVNVIEPTAQVSVPLATKLATGGVVL